MEWCGGRDGGGEAFEMPKPHAVKCRYKLDISNFFEKDWRLPGWPAGCGEPTQ